MQYQLITLPKPTERIWSTAFIVATNGNWMIKGGQADVRNYLGKMAHDGVMFFGKMRNSMSKFKKSINIQIISYGVNVSRRRKPEEKRFYYEIRDVRFGVSWLKVRRLPEKWPKEIPVDLITQLLISADYLEERGFVDPARFLRGITECNNPMERRGVNFY